MKTTVLMIGNWVLDTRTNRPLQVNPFMAELEVPEWTALPLTEDILKRNNFIKLLECDLIFSWKDESAHNIIVNLKKGTLTIWESHKILLYSEFGSDIIPVHYLQNAITLHQINKKITI